MIKLAHIPNGHDEVVAYYGQNTKDAALDPEWVSENLLVFRLKYPMLFWDGVIRSAFQAHKLVGDSLVDALAEFFEATTPQNVQGEDPESYVGAKGWNHFDGCFNYRINKNAPVLSLHAWGAAVDLNAAANPNGQAVDAQPPILVEVLLERGWVRPNATDNMHFQACTGF